MKIAICSAGELFGGVETWIVTFVEYVGKHRPDIKPIVVLFYDGRLAERLRAMGVSVFIPKGSSKYSFAYFAQVKRFFRENNIGVVHTHGYKADIICGSVAKLLGIRLVKTQHGMIEGAFSFSLRAVRMWLNITLMRLFERLCDHVVFVSHDLLAQRRRRKKQWSVIHNGIPALDGVVPVAVDEEHKSFIVGIVGRISEVKGHIYLMRAMRRLATECPGMKIWVIGDGSLDNDLRFFCRKHDILDRVEFHGFRDDVLNYVARCDVFCMPSLHEGLPYTLLEAMYLKVPIVASRVGGLREVLRDRETALLVEPRDVYGLCDALRELYRNHSLAESLVKNAYETVCSEFMIERMVNAYADVYGARSASKK